MRPTTLVSTFSPEGYEEYGKKMVETFLEYWCDEVNLILWLDEAIPVNSERVQQIIGMPTEVVQFRERHRANPIANGGRLMPGPGIEAVSGKYSHKSDAYRFIFLALLPSITAMTMMSRPSRMIWLDGDVHTFDRVSMDFINQVAPEEFDGSYLGRKSTHSETGWLSFNLPESDDLLNEIYETYVNDRCFEGFDGSIMPYVFDSLKESMNMNFFNLVEKGPAWGHVWFRSPLGKCMDHLKGPRYKKAGFSSERFEMEE